MGDAVANYAARPYVRRDIDSVCDRSRRRFSDLRRVRALCERGQDAARRVCESARLGHASRRRRRCDRWRPRRGIDPTPVREDLDLPLARLDQPGNERQAVSAVVRLLPAARLPLERQITDHRDRPRWLIRALRSPHRNRRVVQRTIDAEVETNILGETGRGFACRQQTPGQRRSRARRRLARRGRT